MTEQAQTSQQSERQAAAAIALILLGAAIVPSPVGAIAMLLSGFVPLSVPSALAARLTSETASLALRDLPFRPSSGEVLLAASRAEFSYRAAYAFAALRRLMSAAVEPNEETPAERLVSALHTEERYLEAHKKASGKRLAAARLNDAAAEIYGPILSWNHGPLSPGDRPHHVAADGLNYDVRNPPKETEGLPSTLPNCKCFPGPPREGMRVMK